MAKRVSFNTQLASIMEIVTKTAMTQICKLVDEDSAFVHLEMSRILNENEVLNEKLHCLESELKITRKKGVRNRASYRSVGIQTGDSNRGPGSDNCGVTRTPSINGIFGKEWCINLWADGEPSRGEMVDAEIHSMVDESIEYIQDQTELISVKEENFEEEISSSNPHRRRIRNMDRDLTHVPDRIGSSFEHQHLSDEGPEEYDAQFISDDCLDYHDAQPMLSEYSEEHNTQFISINGLVEPCTQPISTDGPVEYDTHCIPIECVEEQDTDLIAFEGLVEDNSQTVPVDAAAPSSSESGQTFSYFDRFNIHQQGNSEQKDKLSCSVCERKFTRQNTLTLHLKTHKRDRSHTCRVCQSVFPQKNLLRTHKCAPHESVPKVSKSLLRKPKYAPHVKAPNVRNGCEYCGRLFTSQANLRVHYAVHTGERPYSCTFCAKAFTQKGNLTAHLRIHTGEKPFTCGTCGKSFTQKVNLHHHLLVHGKGKRKPIKSAGKTVE